MPDIRLIALDLDGTLFNSDKKITPRTYAALAAAAQQGIEIVPTTGRVYSALPSSILSLPFVRYIISVNGAAVCRKDNGTVLYRSEIPWQRAVDLMQVLDTLPVIYDCFMDNKAFMTERLKYYIDNFAPDEHYRRMLHDVRIPVPELKQFLAERKQDVQKVQFFIRDPERRLRLLNEEMPRRFPDLLISSSVTRNVEFNSQGANKGAAMLSLAEQLGIAAEQTMSFGDGLNDIPMIRAAGLGIGMANACGELLTAADYVTADNDSDGVAQAVEKFCLS